jgi:hypothetical protein
MMLLIGLAVMSAASGDRPWVEFQHCIDGSSLCMGASYKIEIKHQRYKLFRASECNRLSAYFDKAKIVVPKDMFWRTYLIRKVFVGVKSCIFLKFGMELLCVCVDISFHLAHARSGEPSFTSLTHTPKAF